MILTANQISQRNMLDPFRTKYKFQISDGKHISGGLSVASYDVALAESINIRPHGFSLASTQEKFSMPRDVACIVHDKSTWARLGLSVQNTFIDPGWRGFLTLELNNNSDSWIELAKGTPIAQLVFHLLSEDTEAYSGKYQDQESGPQEAR